MKVCTFPISGLLLLELDVHRDSRGFFLERSNERVLAQHGIASRFVQCNHSRSLPRVLRGLHFQESPPQSKLVGVVRGAVWDVAVDLRPGSPTYGQHQGVELDGEKGHVFWIPAGFAHGFCVVGNEPADMLYQVDALFSPAGDRGIAWNDPDLAIQWPIQNPVLSAKDLALPRLKATSLS